MNLIHISYKDLWGKVLDGFLSINPSSGQWFLKVDDDTFVVMRNLRRLLHQLDPNVPFLVGLQLLYFKNTVRDVISCNWRKNIVYSQLVLV